MAAEYVTDLKADVDERLDADLQAWRDRHARVAVAQEKLRTARWLLRLCGAR